MKKISLLLIAFSISLSTIAQDSGDLENQFYFRFGYSNPTNSYLGIDVNSFWDEFNKGGVIFELGQIFMLNGLPLSDGLRLGINADYAEISYNQLSSTTDDSALGIFKVSSKVGPSISYSPVSDLVFDVFIKAKISWVAGMAFVDDGLVVDEGYAGLMGFGFSTGFNVRYRFLMAGIEFNKDSMILESSDTPGYYFGNLGNGDDRTPMPSVSFTFGFSF
jgi:hypothetical protein